MKPENISVLIIVTLENARLWQEINFKQANWKIPEEKMKIRIFKMLPLYFFSAQKSYYILFQVKICCYEILPEKMG